MSNVFNSTDFFKRIISSLFLILIAAISLFTNNIILILTLIFIIIVLTYEWVVITENIKSSLLLFSRILVNISFFSLSLFDLRFSILFILLITILNSFGKKYSKINQVYVYIGPLYICLPLILFYALYISSEFGHDLIVWGLLVVWFTDIFAYLGGNLLKGKKMCPSVSANKTWSGFICGLLGATLISVILFTLKNESIIVAILFGVFISLVAQVGDFFESYIKRQHSIKNSSNLIPGHGGMLDRLDSTLFAFIFIYLGNIWVN